MFITSRLFDRLEAINVDPNKFLDFLYKLNTEKEFTDKYLIVEFENELIVGIKKEIGYVFSPIYNDEEIKKDKNR